MTKTMKAVVLEDFGPADNLKMQEVEVPQPGVNDVLVEVHATSVNLADVGVRSGMFGSVMKPSLVLGFDVAGVIVGVGEGVTGLTVGDEVYYAVELTDPRGGANAEYHVSSADRVARGCFGIASPASPGCVVGLGKALGDEVAACEVDKRLA